jgi:hypothetical protein
VALLRSASQPAAFSARARSDDTAKKSEGQLELTRKRQTPSDRYVVHEVRDPSFRLPQPMDPKIVVNLIEIDRHRAEPHHSPDRCGPRSSRATQIEWFFTASPMLLENLPSVHPSSGFGIVQGQVERGVQRAIAAPRQARRRVRLVRDGSAP